jgi:hypothetical protein
MPDERRPSRRQSANWDRVGAVANASTRDRALEASADQGRRRQPLAGRCASTFVAPILPEPYASAGLLRAGEARERNTETGIFLILFFM